mmetsp:Transcript_4916/g.7414  ORF Transcript_4916/g.7414 Transcript_4916/m.7414 type:complete len:106 (+) Transcript_4916:468-785(+)
MLPDASTPWGSPPFPTGKPAAEASLGDHTAAPPSTTAAVVTASRRNMLRVEAQFFSPFETDIVVLAPFDLARGADILSPAEKALLDGMKQQAIKRITAAFCIFFP